MIFKKKKNNKNILIKSKLKVKYFRNQKMKKIIII
jgi:hypothetical protein